MTVQWGSSVMSQLSPSRSGSAVDYPFIAAARDAMPLLLAEMARLREERDAWRAGMNAAFKRLADVVEKRNEARAERDALEARVAALEAAGDALEAALTVYVSRQGRDAKVLAWRRVAERRAVWREARAEPAGVPGEGAADGE